MASSSSVITACLLSVLSCNAFGEDLSPAGVSQLNARASEAREACAAKIHFDTYSFESCIDKLSKNYNKDALSQLGTYYAGFAVALSTTRVGMTGAEETAKHFYWRYRPLQTKLGIDDMTLCSTLPGNCQIRIAQTIELAKQPKPKRSAAAQKQTSDHDH